MGRRRAGDVPAYRLHKQSGQAYVNVGGKDRMLGRFGSPESLALYREIVREYEQQLRQQPVTIPTGVVRVADLCAAFMQHANQHYARPDGTLSDEVSGFKNSLKLLLDSYGKTLVNDFAGPDLEKVRQAMIAAGWCKTVVNQRVGRVRRVFRWGLAKDIVRAETMMKLEAVTDLQLGRGTVRETAPIRSVRWEHFRQTLRFLTSRQLRGMAWLQWYVGMRPGEVCAMRSGDIHQGGSFEVGGETYTLPAGMWAYVVRAKMAHCRRQPYQIYEIGPRAQKILTLWLRDDPEEYLFQPREAIAEQRRRLRARRKSKVQPSQQTRRKKKPIKQPGERYHETSYSHAIGTACDRALAWLAERGIKSTFAPWHPHQIRHTVKDRVQRLGGIEAARAVLTHVSVNTTRQYGQQDLDLAARVVSQLG